MKTCFIIIVALLALLPAQVFAMLDIEQLTPARVKELGVQVKAWAAGPDLARIELTFDPRGDLKAFMRVDMLIQEQGKLKVSAALKEEPSTPAVPGRIVVDVAVDRADIDKLTFRIVTGDSRDHSGYDLRAKDFVPADLDKAGGK